MRTCTRSARRSFTLVELLVVISIIGILTALISAAALGARKIAQETAVLTELMNLSGAMERYASEYGSYPPNFTNQAAVERHLRRRFPRIQAAEVQAIWNLRPDPAEAIVFWLQGFSPDPLRPHTGSGTRVPEYDFDRSRLVASPNGGGRLIYVPPYGAYDDDGTARPYIYFSAANYQDVSYSVGGTVLKRPYRSSNIGDFYVNPGSFQLLSAGLDAKWGNNGSNNNPFFPSGDNYQKGDRDNLANFARKNLENSIP